MRNNFKKKKHKKKGHPSIELGPSLPKKYECKNTCVFYFNINGSFNDTSNIYLMVFTNNWRGSIFYILKNNEWVEEFPNKTKLIFLKHDCGFNCFGCDFMVCLVLLICVCVCVYKNNTK